MDEEIRLRFFFFFFFLGSILACTVKFQALDSVMVAECRSHVFNNGWVKVLNVSPLAISGEEGFWVEMEILGFNMY